MGDCTHPCLGRGRRAPLRVRCRSDAANSGDGTVEVAVAANGGDGAVKLIGQHLHHFMWALAAPARVDQSHTGQGRIAVRESRREDEFGLSAR
eukprot:scaffold5751_cov112-Isochrysis_galbana.AAC.1